VTFTVLFVCTGNVCRSPVAERLFLARMRSGADMVATSAGLFALEGNGIDPPSARALIELGGDPSAHHARWFTPTLAESADLILTAQTSHRADVLRAVPAAMRRTFSLREFARLATAAAADPAAADPAAEPGPDPAPDSRPDRPPDAPLDPREQVGRIAGLRGVVPAPAPGADDIGDPFGRSIGVARTCAAQIAAAVDVVLAALDAAT